ncbi:metal-dependent transcriptional regulator [Streptomyces gardneri]|uniref:metal-dependent transcriptional regulator n=1 Tax=Streptomyces gardneri TaxID=66892 RepID=UPI0036748308
MTSRIHLAVEQGQKPLSVVITAGQRGDSPQFEPVLEAIRVPRLGAGQAAQASDRHLELTEEGRRLATRVMRKHRLAECPLVDVIGLEWEQVHAEACRWEHVLSEAVEPRVLELLRQSTELPYGNPIPGLEELGEKVEAEAFLDDSMVSLADLDATGGKTVVVRCIGEPIQTDAQLMYTLRRAGVQPGSVVSVSESPGGILVGSSGEAAELDPEVAAHVFVAKR